MEEEFKKVDLITLLRTFKKEGIENFIVTRKKYIETVLSELEKKDSLINEQLKENVRLQNELNEENKRCMILANNDKFKEQVIDEMAKYINNFDIDEDICKKVDEPCKNYAGENGKLCNECIIKYFTNKVEREGK